MRFFKRLFRVILQTGLIGLVTLMLFEISYRLYLIDFYKSEHLALNSKKDLEKKQSDILIFGDSFSATSKEINYVDRLRESYPNKTILNFSIPGTGIRQLNVFAGKKIKQYKPKHIIYQIYAGNDLLDVKKFEDFKKVSVLKYAFWQVSDVFLGLSYINHKSTVFKPKINYRHRTLKLEDFSVKDYNKRSKDYIEINPRYIEQNSALEDQFINKYNTWLEEIKSLIDVIPNGTKISFVWIPHCSQVNTYYLNNFERLGASFNNKEKHLEVNYKFYLKAVKDLSYLKTLHHVNALEVFKQTDNDTQRLFFPNDPHLNKKGNSILASHLINNLQE
jgi:hypothetical protein